MFMQYKCNVENFKVDFIPTAQRLNFNRNYLVDIDFYDVTLEDVSSHRNDIDVLCFV